MKIAFLINTLSIGGAERVFVRDANEFARRGDTVTLFVLYGDPRTQPLANELDTAVHIESIQARGPFDWSAAWEIARSCRASDTSALISTLNDANIVARWAAIASGGKLRVYLREANDPRRKTWWQRILDIACDGLATKIIAVTEQVRTSMLRDAPWRRAKIVVLHNSLDVPALLPHARHSPIHILAAGRLTKQKDHASLITALHQLADADIDFTATIAGDGPLLQTLKTLAASLGARIRFAGALERAALETEYRDADVFVLSSRWEGCPNVILEAMAYGLPVVATNVGGVPELVKDGETGILVPAENPAALADALRQIIIDPKRGARLGHAGYLRARDEFSTQQRFDRLADIIQE